MAQDYGLGASINVIMAASSVTVPLTRASAVEFHSFEADGTTIMTVTEVDSTGVNSEQALDVQFKPHKVPGVGGTWTAMAEQDATVDLGADATNDQLRIIVHGTQLSDGYDGVQVTTDGGILAAIVVGLVEQKDPPNLTSNIVA
ncbi:MAG: hypothetical protein IIB67_08445 [Proteobacteria bacterium]|nr:hypothetical protein [Pseudomonadota bacterium]